MAKRIGWDVRNFFRRNGLSVVLIGLFLATYLGGQMLAGWHVHNEERAEHGWPTLNLASYFASAHFLEATAENWESEFLQMFAYVYMTAFLCQRGSAESRDPNEPRETIRASPDSPWPVRKGGLWLKLYAHSLSLCLAMLFLASFWLHACGSLRLENEERAWAGEGPLTLGEHLAGAKFWFESFQNWQSEFLAIASMVLLSIFLREWNSPESKPVAAPHGQTG